jgi:hypothetical protein
MAHDEYERSLLGLIDDRAQDYGNARVAQNKTNVGPQAREAYAKTVTLPVDDGNPPAAPTGVARTNLARAVRVTWDTPPGSDYVVRSRVEYTNTVSTEVRTVEVDANSYVITGGTVKPGEQLSILIYHIDAFDRVSVAAGPFLNTPVHTTAEEIELSVAGSISSGGNITVSGTGYMEAGGARMDSDGMRLTQEFTSRDGMWPGSAVADWITGKTGTHPSGSGTALPYAGIAFFNQASPSFRGIIMEAIGVVTSSKAGNILIRATDGATTGMQTDAQTVYIDMMAGVSPSKGDIFIKGITQFFDDVTINGLLTATGQIDFSNSNLWMTGGYKEVSTNPGGSWGRQTSTTTAKRIANFVFLSGRFTNNSGSVNNPGSVITDLGADFRPAQFKYIVCPSTTGGDYVGQCRVVIESGTGQVKLAPAGGGAANDVNAGQSVSLDGVVFSVN